MMLLNGTIDMATLQEETIRTGRFGEYGGRFVPETLIAALDELTGPAADRVAAARRLLAAMREGLRDGQ